MFRSILLFFAFSFLYTLHGQQLDWVHQYPASLPVRPLDVCADSQGNSWTVGQFGSTVDFDGGAGTHYITGYSINAFIVKNDADGNFLWAGSIVGAGVYVYLEAIVADDSGNVYLGGYLDGTADLDFGPGVFNVTSESAYFFMKLNSAGETQWIKTIDALVSGVTYQLHMALDEDANVIIQSEFNSLTDFDPGPGVYTLNGTLANGEFVLKLTNAGDFVWANAFVGNLNIDFANVVVDHNNEIVVAGRYTDSLDLDPGAGEDYGDTPSSHCLIKLDADGNYVWGKSFMQGISFGGFPIGLAVDANNNLYFCGMGYDTVDVDPGPDSTLLELNNNAGILLKLNPDGNLIWHHVLESDDDWIWSSFYTDITINQHQDLILSGEFGGTVDFDPGAGETYQTSIDEYNQFIQKLDSAGNFYWAVKLGGMNSENINALACDPTNGIYAVGHFEDTLDFDPGDAVFAIGEKWGMADGFVWKLNDYAFSELENESETNVLRVYPNPTNGIFTLQGILSNSTIEITTLFGEIILTERASDQVDLDLGTYAAGIYFVTVYCNEQYTVTKLIKY